MLPGRAMRRKAILNLRAIIMIIMTKMKQKNPTIMIIIIIMTMMMIMIMMSLRKIYRVVVKVICIPSNTNNNNPLRAL